jgi:hypothetical protein
MMALELELLSGEFAVCRLEAGVTVPEWALTGSLASATRTADEVSIVCPASEVPAGVRAENGWHCLKIRGPLPFSLTGVLASVVQPLAEAGISLFALSTYDTDYVLVKAETFPRALEALSVAGHRIVGR